MKPPPERQDASPADQATVRRLNLALVLRAVLAAGTTSRSALAETTGLRKNTVSSLVGELVSRGLLREGPVLRGAIGRPTRVIEADRGTVCFVGLEINLGYLAAVVLDIAGRPVTRRRIGWDAATLGPVTTLARAADLVAALLDAAAEEGRLISRLHVALPGLVDTGRGVLAHAPNLHWVDIDVVGVLAGHLGLDTRHIGIDNDANLAALAEWAVGPAAGTDDLLFVTGETGIGGGVIAGGQLLRGASGYFGEIGHMAVTDVGTRCGCGRLGCWETEIGLQALVRAMVGPGDPLVDPAVPLDTRLEEIRRRAESGQPAVLAALDTVGRHLGRGSAALVNIFNPSVVVFGGYIAALADLLAPAVALELAARVVQPEGPCAVRWSVHGFEAAALGGAHAGIELVKADPTLVPVHLPVQPGAREDSISPELPNSTEELPTRKAIA
ncbi:ROK family protein [Nakamurella sp. YIM 132087]|uniref:ROK family protein n=1 Tax=Nakamurella alba TaxID=2665158 RepID=A0A7K1FLX8_9ACTN|nr:ROK family transcriptional regulator [Nakamurella alba]MTD13894.1 ROK family protein [Nakamurella alba]